MLNNINVTADALIRTIQPITTGWANYFRHVVTKEIFNGIDHFIHEQTIKWIRQKHPQKKSTLKWLKNLYFRGWDFRDKDSNNTLGKISDTPIRRHIKVRTEERVYSRESIGYWVKREYLKAKDSIFEGTQLKRLFQKQKGKCEYCKGKIAQEDIQNHSVHKHHITPRNKGGKDT